MTDSSAMLVAQFEKVYADESAGQLVVIFLDLNEYTEMPTLELNASVVASGVTLVGGLTAGHGRRLAASGDTISSSSSSSSSEVTLRPKAGAQLLRTLPGAPSLQLRGLRLQGQVHVNGSHVDFDQCAFEDSVATEGGALAVVNGAVVQATDCSFTRCTAEKGGAVSVDGGRAAFAACRFNENTATTREGGSALHVRSTTGDGVVLTQGTLLEHNSEPSIRQVGGLVTYQLPAPLGRFLNAAGANRQVLSGSVAADFPLACAPGVSGTSDLETAQNGPWCTELCPAGKMCPGATGVPLPCGAGGYCAGSNAFATPCPQGRYSSATNLTSADGCLPCLAGSACLAGSVAPTVCAPGSIAPSQGTATCQQCEAGTYQASRGATSCETCPTTSWCAEGSSAPTPCASGSYSNRVGLQNATECLRCPEGSWCSAGKVIACGLGTYNNGTGATDQSACTYCPSNSFTEGESKTRLADCVCEPDYYALWSTGTLTCDTCPVGADCSAPGSELATLPLEEGYWRARTTTVDVRRCPGDVSGSGCVGGSGGACKAGLEGPYCVLCTNRTDNYYDRDKRECLPCDVVSSAPLIGVAAGVLLAGSLITVCLVKKRRWLSDGATVPMTALNLARPMRWWERHAGSIKRRLKIKVKVLWSFYQVVTKVGETYMITFPEGVERTLDTLSFVNFELDALGLPLACVKLSGFRSKLLFMMLVPIGVLLCTEIIGWFLRDRSHERELQKKATAAAVSGNRWRQLRVAFRQSSYAALPMALRVTFLAFPTVSSLAFKAFRCDDLDANDDVKVGVMSADFAVECWDEQGDFTDEYQNIRMLAFVAIFAYPVAVPIVYSILFWKARRAIWAQTATGLSESITFLTEEYDRSFFFWELLEVLKKLLLVGAMSVVLPGTFNQLALAFVISLCFLVMLMVAKPYKRPEDDVIALTAGFALVMFFFFTLILKVQTLTEAVEDSLTGQLAKAFAIDDQTNAALLLASTLGALLLGSTMVVIEITVAAAAQAKESRKQAAMQQQAAEALRREAAERVVREAEVAELQTRLKEQLETLKQVEELGFARREVPHLARYRRGDINPASGRAVINEPGKWHFMISYSQQARLPPQIALNLTNSLQKQGYLVWFDVSMEKKDAAAMREGIENSMMVICLPNSEGPGDALAYFMRPFCRMEMNWALANEECTGGLWSKIQPVFHVQDDRVTLLLSDLSDEHLKSGKNPSMHMRRADVHNILERDPITYNTTDADYQAVGQQKLIAKLEAMAGDRLSEEAMSINASADADGAERADHEACLNLSTELPDGATQHFVIFHAADREEVAWVLGDSLSDRGYLVRMEPVSPDDDSVRAAVDSALVVVPIVSEGFLNAYSSSDVLRWAREGEKVMQPIVHVGDKRRISEWIGRVPPWVRSKDWIDLNPGDEDYWMCGVRKLLKGAGDEIAKPAAERHDKSVVVSQAPPTARRLSQSIRQPPPVLPRPISAAAAANIASSDGVSSSAGGATAAENDAGPSANEKIRSSHWASIGEAEGSASAGQLLRTSIAASEMELAEYTREHDTGSKDRPGREFRQVRSGASAGSVTFDVAELYA